MHCNVNRGMLNKWGASCAGPLRSTEVVLFLKYEHISLSSQQHTEQNLCCSRHWIKVERDEVSSVVTGHSSIHSVLVLSLKYPNVPLLYMSVRPLWKRQPWHLCKFTSYCSLGDFTGYILTIFCIYFFSSFICHAQLDLFYCSPLANRRYIFKTLRISLSGRLSFQVFFSLRRDICVEASPLSQGWQSSKVIFWQGFEGETRCPVT